MKFVFLTSGRFHVFDQVRELINLGHEVKLYTLVPPRRAVRFGVPKTSVVWMAPKISFYMLLFLLFRKTEKKQKAYRMINTALDKKMAKLMPDCDVFISMSGMCINSLRVAKTKKILTILQRSSRHIESQAEILREFPDSEQVDPWVIDQELSEYDLADFITVLSQHSVDSFLERGFSKKKLLKIMPGVDLTYFTVSTAKNRHPPAIIYTGVWCTRKGSDLLIEAWRRLRNTRWPDLQLLHVGSLGDVNLPDDDGFVHVDHVDQSALPDYYNRADVFCLPSREDGFGVVLLQALACGLRLVCSDKTGGVDVLEVLGDGDAVRIFKAGSVEDLTQKLEEALSRASVTESEDFLGSDRENFSWKKHAESLAGFMDKQVGAGECN